MIRVLIVASVRLYREGLQQVLGQRPGIAVIGNSPTAAQALTDATALRPDVVLMDMATPNGATTIQSLRAMGSPCRIIGVAVSAFEEDIVSCLKAGIAGYVPVDGSLDDLVKAIESATRGVMICPPSITGALARCVANLAPADSATTSLTYREREIIHLVHRGWSNKQIGQQLHIALATVKNHIHHVLKKLRVRKRGELAARIGFPPMTFSTGGPVQTV